MSGSHDRLFGSPLVRSILSPWPVVTNVCATILPNGCMCISTSRQAALDRQLLPSRCLYKSIKFQATSGLNEDIGEERKLELPGRSLLDAATVRKPWGEKWRTATSLVCVPLICGSRTIDDVEYSEIIQTTWTTRTAAVSKREWRDCYAYRTTAGLILNYCALTRLPLSIYLIIL